MQDLDKFIYPSLNCGKQLGIIFAVDEINHIIEFNGVKTIEDLKHYLVRMKREAEQQFSNLDESIQE